MQITPTKANASCNRIIHKEMISMHNNAFSSIAQRYENIIEKKNNDLGEMKIVMIELREAAETIRNDVKILQDIELNLKMELRKLQIRGPRIQSSVVVIQNQISYLDDDLLEIEAMIFRIETFICKNKNKIKNNN